MEWFWNQSFANGIQMTIRHCVRFRNSKCHHWCAMVACGFWNTMGQMPIWSHIIYSMVLEPKVRALASSPEAQYWVRFLMLVRHMCLSVCTVNLTLACAMLLTSYFTFLQFSQNIFGSLNCPRLNIKIIFFSNPAPHTRSTYNYSKFGWRKVFWSIVASE